MHKKCARTEPQLPKIMRPKQPQFSDVANVRRAMMGLCSGDPHLVIRDDSSASMVSAADFYLGKTLEEEQMQCMKQQSRQEEKRVENETRK
ncbi:hypothetical protein CDAR_418471 [Caerostris darwini]|uniref:Uncharacterized protein n=1 Tax=Caerostris darwini TaxID=1538125 RepID=A0AAV4MUW3_9ARAC|nr:hypothetical protein CDAR_418471 [Caerostris darwini]